jgi:hypothetical protein
MMRKNRRKIVQIPETLNYEYPEMVISEPATDVKFSNTKYYFVVQLNNKIKMGYAKEFDVRETARKLFGVSHNYMLAWNVGGDALKAREKYLELCKTRLSKLTIKLE